MSTKWTASQRETTDLKTKGSAPQDKDADPKQLSAPPTIPHRTNGGDGQRTAAGAAPPKLKLGECAPAITEPGTTGGE
jgi:hypothetical protein